MSPLISIILPVYNVEKYIVSCLRSIAEQTFKDYELLIIDDCGLDNSIEHAQDYLSNIDIDWHLIHQSRNCGVSAARNRGILESKGKYVMFVDSDDELTRDCLSILANPTAQTNYDIIIGGFENFGKKTEQFKSEREKILLSNEDVIECYAKGGWHIMPWNKLCRKDFIIENNLLFLDGQALHEDFIWSFEVACKAKTAFVTDRVTYRYRINNESVMNTTSIEADLAAYVPAFLKMIQSAARDSGNEQWKYYMIEGKKCGILYSLLQNNEITLYKKYYPEFRKSVYISPLKALFKGIISPIYFIRDLDNLLPMNIAVYYKRMFYTIVYKARNKHIEGALWE